MKRTTLALLCALSCLVTPALAESKAETKAKGQSFALLVGINEYKMKPLSGAVNDVKDLHNVLVKVFNFSDDKKHIVELLDGDATKKRILEMFRSQLIDNAKNNPDGMFVFQFSGHGTQVTDDKAHQDELDGLDEALVPGDVNSKVFKSPDQLRSALITDDELSALLRELCQATKNVIIITDSCRSGTNLRSAGRGYTSRFVEMKDLGLDIPRKRQSETLQNSDSFEKFDIPSDRYIAISGSDASHNAIETFQKVSDADDKFNGLMTANLLPLLTNSRSDITYRQLADRLRALVAGESAQNPQVEGDLDRYVFSDHGERADAFIPVKKLDKETVIIGGGTALGIKPGAIISFYDKKSKKLRGKDGLLTTGSVSAAAPFESTVQLPAGVNNQSLQEAKAIVASVQAASQKPVICLDKNMGKLLGDESLKPFFEDLKKEAEREQSVDFQMEPIDIWSKGQKKWDLAICQRNFDLLYLVRPTGQTVQHSWVNIMQTNAAAEIIGKARRSVNQDMLRALFNETSTLNGQVAVTLWRAVPAKDSNWTKGEQLAKSEATPHINIGERFIISVENKSQTPLYIGTISLATSGAIIPLYPKAAGAAEALMPGQVKDLPVCKVGGPPGEETVKIIASTEPVDLTLLKQESITRGDEKLSKIKANSLQLQAILMRAAGTLSRGESISTANTDQDWTASSFNLIIESNPQSPAEAKPLPAR